VVKAILTNICSIVYYAGNLNICRSNGSINVLLKYRVTKCENCDFGRKRVDGF
jgi:hypothetical protein